MELFDPAKTIVDCFRYRKEIGIDIAEERACFMIQARDRSSFPASRSTWSAKGVGTCAVNTRVSVFDMGSASSNGALSAVR